MTRSELKRLIRETITDNEYLEAFKKKDGSYELVTYGDDYAHGPFIKDKKIVKPDEISKLKPDEKLAIERADKKNKEEDDYNQKQIEKQKKEKKKSFLGLWESNKNNSKQSTSHIMKKSELKALIREVIEEVAGKYWDEDTSLRNIPFNIIAGEEAILNKEWFTSVIDHLYYRKEDDFLRLDGSYKTIDGSGKGRFSVFVESDGTLGAETNGDIKGHWSGHLNDKLPIDPPREKQKHTLYLSGDARTMVSQYKKKKA